MNEAPPSDVEAHPDWMASLLGETLPEAPFPGLRPFEPEEEVVFFGRDQQVNAVLRRLAGSGFVAVVGPSGCGKSSLVKAGVIPALEAGRYYEAGTDWVVVQMRPGTAPLWNLARAFLMRFRAGEQPDAAHIAVAAATLSGSDSPVRTLLDEFGVPRARNVLILVDQFEELFRYETQSLDAEEAQDLVKLLISLSRNAEENVSCILTMRTDHFGDCTHFEGLPEIINETLFLTPQLSEAEKRAAIEGPIRLFGDQIEAVLTDELIRDMGNVDDQLPLMQHVLLRLWRQASNDGEMKGVVLRRDDYARLGGLHEALDRHAGDVLREIKAVHGEPGQRLTESLFRQLTERRDDSAGQDVRRPMRFGQLADGCGVVSDEDRDMLADIIRVFVRADVGFVWLAPAGRTLGDATLIDIVHECLIRKWSTLQEWVGREWEAARRLRDLAASAALRKGSGILLNSQEVDYYARWREEAAPDAGWAARYGVSPEALEDGLALLDASAEAEKAAGEEAEKAALDGLRQKAEQETRKRRNLAYAGLFSIFTVILVVSAMAIERRAQERYDTRLKKLFEEQKELSELIHRSHRANAESMLDLRKRIGSENDQVENNIANPKKRLSGLAAFQEREAELKIKADRTLKRAVYVARKIDYDPKSMVADHKTRMDELLASFDRQTIQLHTEVQRDIAKIPRPLGPALADDSAGNTFAIAVRPDGRLLARAISRSVGAGESAKTELSIVLSRIPGAAPPSGKVARVLTGGTLSEASVLEMTFSPDGRHLAATLIASDLDDIQQVWIMVWDITRSQPVDRVAVPWEVTDYAGTTLAVSGDSSVVGVVDAGGSTVICRIGQCSDRADRSRYRHGRVAVQNKLGPITETLSFLGLVTGPRGSILGLYRSQESQIWVYRLSLDTRTDDADTLISEPDWRLPWMPRLKPKVQGEGQGMFYCAADDSLIAIDDRRGWLQAWKLSGTGPPNCQRRIVHRNESGPLEIWRLPRESAGWQPAAEVFQDQKEVRKLYRNWELRAFTAELISYRDLESAYLFPVRLRLIQYELDARGRILATLGLQEGMGGSGRGAGGTPTVTLWSSRSGHHIAYLGGGSEIDREFVPPMGGHELTWAEPVRVSGRYPDPVTLDGGRLSKVMQPSWQWRHSEGAISMAVLSADGRYAALSVPSGGGKTAEPVLEIWDTKTGKLKARLLHKSPVVKARFLGDGGRVAALTQSHGAWISAWRPDDLRRELCGRLGVYDVLGVELKPGMDICKP